MQHPRELLKIPGNETCADCRGGQATWASVNLGILVCIECSGVHRSLGTHISSVKSLTLDQWRPEWIDKVQQIGNNQSNSFYERGVPPKYQPLFERRASSRADRDRYVKLKYVRRRFAPSSQAPHEFLSQGLELPSSYDAPEALPSDDEEDVAPEDTRISDQQAAGAMAGAAAGAASPGSKAGPSTWALPFQPPSGAAANEFLETATASIGEAQRKGTEVATAAWEKVPSRTEVASGLKTVQRGLSGLSLGSAGANAGESAGRGEGAGGGYPGGFGGKFAGFASGLGGFAAAAAGAAASAAAAAAEKASAAAHEASASQAPGAAEAGSEGGQAGFLSGKDRWKAAFRQAAATTQVGLQKGLVVAEKATVTAAAGASDLFQSVDKLVQAATRQDSSEFPEGVPGAAAAASTGVDLGAGAAAAASSSTATAAGVAAAAPQGAAVQQPPAAPAVSPGAAEGALSAAAPSAASDLLGFTATEPVPATAQAPAVAAGATAASPAATSGASADLLDIDLASPEQEQRAAAAQAKAPAPPAAAAADNLLDF